MENGSEETRSARLTTVRSGCLTVRKQGMELLLLLLALRAHDPILGFEFPLGIEFVAK